MGNNIELRKNNLLEVIKTIIIKRNVTKPEIAMSSGLTSVTVHNFINSLVAEGACVEKGRANSRGGRKATIYEINENFCYIIGVEVCRNHLKIRVTDFGMTCIYSYDLPHKPIDSMRTISCIIERIQTAIDESQVPVDRIIGVGISLPGKVDRYTGTVIHFPGIPNWSSVPIASQVSRAVNLPVYVSNDNNARALAIKWKGMFPDEQDAVFLNITSGVGTGVLIGGNLLYGSNSYAGELGHTTIQYNGPVCNCGARGCIEVMTTDQTIIDRASKLYDFQHETDGDITIDDVVKAALLEQDSPVYGILKETALFISITLDHIVKLYDPKTIIITNNWLHLMPDIYYYCTDTLFARNPWLRRDLLNIELITDELLANTAMAYIVLENVMTLSENNAFLDLLDGNDKG